MVPQVFGSALWERELLGSDSLLRAFPPPCRPYLTNPNLHAFTGGERIPGFTIHVQRQRARGRAAVAISTNRAIFQTTR